LLLASLSYELCNMKHTKSLNNDFLQIIDIGKSWFKLVEMVYSATYWKFKRSKMFFPFRSTPRKHWQPRGSHRARAVTWITRIVCETVSGGRCPCVRKNRARARTRKCFTALLDSSRTERTRTSWAFACVRRSLCGNIAFFSRSDFLLPLTHTETLLSIWRYALIWMARWAKMKVKSEKDELCCHRMLTLTLPIYNFWIWGGKKYLRSLAEIFYIILYIPRTNSRLLPMPIVYVRTYCFRILYFI